MKKRSIAARLGVAALALTLITASLSSGTLAKYYSEFHGTAQVQVARWNVGVKIGGQRVTTGVETVNLANTVTSTVNKSTVAGATGGTAKPNFIAPGMEGRFQISVSAKNFSDVSGSVDDTQVAVDYFIVMKPEDDEVKMPEHFVFFDTKDGAVDADAAINNDDLRVEFKEGYGEKIDELGWILSQGILKVGDTADKTVTIGWAWPYEYRKGASGVDESVVDSQDTLNGMSPDDVADAQKDDALASGDTRNYTVTIIMRQHDPRIPVTYTSEGEIYENIAWNYT